MNERWIEMEDGTYPDGFPKNVYRHESCEVRGESVRKAYPFCPYCGKKITHIKVFDNCFKECAISFFKSKGFICE